MSRNIADALGERIPARGYGCLHDVDLALTEHLVQIPILRLHKVHWLETFILEKTRCYRRQQWTIEGRMAIHHDAYLLDGHVVIVASTRINQHVAAGLSRDCDSAQCVEL